MTAWFKKRFTMTNSSEELVTFFKALADKNRLKIVGLLAEKPYSVEELATLLGLKPPTISHHLRVLREAGWIAGERRATWVWYSIRPEAVARFRELAGGLGPAYEIAVADRRLPVVQPSA